MPDLVAEVLHAAATLEKHVAQPPETTPPPGTALDKQFAIGVCNEYFRLACACDSIEKRMGDAQASEPRRIRASLKNVSQYCKNQGIEWQDVRDEEYKVTRPDFEPIDQQEVPGLKHMQILRCERPVVRLHGKIIQKARGVVGRPPRDQTDLKVEGER